MSKQFVMVFRPGPRKHKGMSDSCPSCEKGYPKRCECGGMLHSETVVTDGTNVIECDLCNHKESNRLSVSDGEIP